MFGAIYEQRRCRFSVWAPRLDEVAVHIVESGGKPRDRVIPMVRGEDGVHRVMVEDVVPGTLYYYRLGPDRELPDPASRRQPRGVHGPSAVVDPSFEWNDQRFACPPLSDLVIYELHVGTFSAEGTFRAVVEHLDTLRELGVSAIELMPLAQFPGHRNWGYDGVYPYAVQESYGGLTGLQRLVESCHQRGMAVILDVVHNHLGPEGNHLAEYGPYFTDRYKTPWGAALNFDGPDSDPVRRFFIDSALFYMDACHIDGFRLDAIHAIVDTSAQPFLRELTAAIHQHAQATGRRGLVIGESDLNDPRVLLGPELGGMGMDAQWADDFHHAVHALITGEQSGYFQDFGALDQLARAYTNGYVYTGQWSAYRRRRHGSAPVWCPGSQFVVFTQNHDQVGNRAAGERLSASLTPQRQALAACLQMLAPYVPLIFMGQEFGETAPFQYFTSFENPELAEAVREGRRAEFGEFGWEPQGIADPQDEETFARSRLNWDLIDRQPHASLWALYRTLIRLRRTIPALRALDRARTQAVAYEREQILMVRRTTDDSAVIALFDLRPEGKAQSFDAPLGKGRWRIILDTSARDPARPAGGERPFSCQGLHSVSLTPSACLLFTTE
jgi:maltooligosyltrehalose trehalohydrolase